MPDRFAAGLFQGGNQSRFYMDAISGAFPLLSTLTGFAQGARFVGATDEIRSITTKTLTHNIVDYKFAIFFIAHFHSASFQYYSVMGALNTITTSLSNVYHLTGFSASALTEPSTAIFPDSITVNGVNFSMSPTTFTIQITLEQRYVDNLWLFVY